MKDNQRIALTKRLLAEGLLRLLQNKPIEKINVSELCEESGINRATFYRHYEQPRDVLFDVDRELIQEVRTMYPQPKSLQEAEKYFESILAFFAERSELIKILVQCRLDENFTHVLDEFYKTLLELKGEIHGISDLDDDSAKLLSSCLVGGVYFLLRQWLMDDVKKTPKEVAMLIFRFLDKELEF